MTMKKGKERIQESKRKKGQGKGQLSKDRKGKKRFIVQRKNKELWLKKRSLLLYMPRTAETGL